MMKDQSPFIIGAFKITSTVDLPVSAAIHGDEMIGVEIARRLLRAPQLDRIKGTLLVIPIVNSIGFLDHSRYLPDRRDLN